MKRFMKAFFSLFMAFGLTLLLANSSSDLKNPVMAEEDASVTYQAAFADGTTSDWIEDGKVLVQNGSYPISFAAQVKTPEGMSGGISYFVNVSGKGWVGPYENGAVVSATETNPIEGLKVTLTGDVAEYYDVCTKSLVNGGWLNWQRNGDESGIIGKGTHIDGFQITIVKKGEDPKSSAYSFNGRNIDPTKPMIALTYDDGPGRYEDRIMNVFDQYGGKATFFMVGNLVGSHASSVKRMADSGHELGNHSWNHDNLAKLGSDAICNTIRKTNSAVESATGGARVTVVRPPYGATGGSCKSALGSMGYASILWNIDTLDWKTKNADSTVNCVLSQVKDGDIILMHSIYEATAVATERMVPELVRRGFQLVTVSELANARGGMAPGVNYGRFRP